MPADDLFLGIDGGASKTRGVLAGAGGHVLATAAGPGSAIVGAPCAEALGVLRAVVAELCVKAATAPGAVAKCAIGLSGVDFADELPLQQAAIAEALGVPPQALSLVNDGIVALWGASPAPAAAILQYGSAFTAAYRSRHGTEALFDHLSVGRPLDLRDELLALLARMLDGREPPTPLLATALDYLEVTPATFCEAVYRRRIPDVKRRSTAPLVFAAWREGDPAAARLVEAAARDYALAAGAMVTRTGCEHAEVCFGGGVFAQAPPAFRERLATLVRERHPCATVTAPALPPEYGAVVLAGFTVGRDPVALFRVLRKGAP